MNITQIVQQQLIEEANYEYKRRDLEKQASKIAQQLKGLEYPHWSSMLSQVITKLNQAIADRGYAFATSGYATFGLDPSINVFQDMSRSCKLANSYLKFIFTDALYAYDGQQLVKINKLEDLIILIDKQRLEHETEIQGKIQQYGSIKNLKDAVKNNKIDFHYLPENEQTEDILIHCIKNDVYILKHIPAGMITYGVLISLFESPSIYKSNVYPILDMFSKSQMLCDLVDKELFKLATEHGICLFPFFSADKLMELCDIDPEAIRNGIQKDYEFLYYIPESYMKEKYLFDLAKTDKTLAYFKWDKLKGLDTISQETAELLFDKEPKVFTVLPNKYKTLEMCHRAVKQSKSYQEFVPPKYLTEKGNLKRLPK